MYALSLHLRSPPADPATQREEYDEALDLIDDRARVSVSLSSSTLTPTLLGQKPE